MALHVLLLSESGCEIYGPYKGSSSAADRQYIFSRTADHDSCCLAKLQPRSLRITSSVCGPVRRPQSVDTGVKLCFGIFIFSAPSPPSPHVIRGDKFGVATQLLL